MELQKFKIKVLPLRPKLLRHAEKLTGSGEDAEDIVQEVLLRLWKRRAELERCENIEAFSTTLVRHLSIDQWRKRRPESRESGEESGIEYTTPERLLEIKDSVRLIQEIIATLPALQQSVVRMKDVEGYETEEIAEIIGCQPEAVRSNLSRARRKVRDIYLQIVQEKNRRNKNED